MDELVPSKYCIKPLINMSLIESNYLFLILTLFCLKFFYDYIFYSLFYSVILASPNILIAFNPFLCDACYYLSHLEAFTVQQ